MICPETRNLNLARKWRPQTFDSIVGQDIPVRMLKNSLYLQKYFPVYLFSGQRGCGKTTTARVFAAAINCQNLARFQAEPANNPLPCQTCQSCMWMSTGSHPDFSEIDAASHTGVDNVRSIIEQASYVPLTGNKKIYLIDEAHMLSKAAFNAFLKILEEPPATVLFMLATTELHKIPETVLSRCFQLTFGSIEHQELKQYLQAQCLQENITIEDDALDSIIEEAEGCARDAINILEQVRFAGTQVTHEQVLKILGKVSNQVLLTVFDHILDKKPQELLSYLATISFQTTNATTMWTMMASLCRALLWVKYGALQLPHSLKKQLDHLQALAKKCSLNRLHAMVQLLWSQEVLFLQTPHKHLFLELVLLQLCEQPNIAELQDLIKTLKATDQSVPPPSPSPKPGAQISRVAKHLEAPSEYETDGDAEALKPAPSREETATQSAEQQNWGQFIANLSSSCGDSLLKAIFNQMTFVGFNSTTGAITIRLDNDNKFIKDKINDSSIVWLSIVKENFPSFSSFIYQANNLENTLQRPVKIQTETVVAPTPKTVSQAPLRSPSAPDQAKSRAIDISDKEKWPLANLILAHFPGKIKTNVVN